MARTYKRKTNRQSWDEISMAKAMEAVLENGSPLQTAAKKFNVARNTLRRRLLLFKITPDLDMALMKGK